MTHAVCTSAGEAIVGDRSAAHGDGRTHGEFRLGFFASEAPRDRAVRLAGTEIEQ
jgi:hypothetical protein